MTGQTLARHFGTIDALMNATQEELVEAEGIGPERAEAIAEWFRDDDNRRLVEELRELGLRFEAGEEERPVEGPLTGRSYVITGTLESMTREEATAALEALGAKVGAVPSSKTTGLVVGEEPGQVEADEGGEGRRPDPQRSRSREAASAVAKRSSAMRDQIQETGSPLISTEKT